MVELVGQVFWFALVLPLLAGVDGGGNGDRNGAVYSRGGSVFAMALHGATELVEDGSALVWN